MNESSQKNGDYLSELLEQAAALHKPDPITQENVNRSYKAAYEIVQRNKHLCLDTVADQMQLIVDIAKLIGEEREQASISVLQLVRARIPELHESS